MWKHICEVTEKQYALKMAFLNECKEKCREGLGRLQSIREEGFCLTGHRRSTERCKVYRRLGKF